MIISVALNDLDVAEVLEALRKALGHEVDFYLAAEEAKGHRLHFHGCFGISVSEAETAREALRVAAGEWPKLRHHQAKTTADPDARWTSYIAKRFHLLGPNTRRRNKHGEDRIDFQGPGVSATWGTIRAAKNVYGMCRTILKKEASAIPP